MVSQTRVATESTVESSACAHSATVVLCAYTEDRWLTLRSAINSAQKQMGQYDELLVVVDYNDSLLAKCREALNDCIVIPNRHSRGLSGARNTGVETASGSIVVFVDDDAVPLQGWLSALRSPYANERVYGVGGFAMPRWLGGRPRWFPDEFLWVVGCSHRGLPTEPRAVRNLLGANMSYRKEACDNLGGFIETMGRIRARPVGCEETEFSIRLAQAHPEAILLYDPSAQVEHYLALERSSLSYFVRRCWGEGLSKAEVTRRVGHVAALSTERHYTSRVLPRAAWRGVREAVSGDLSGIARSLVIVLGLAVTSTGYCAGYFRRHGHLHRTR
jgi:glycosyltransferase involved in cell wall biosynthesis